MKITGEKIENKEYTFEYIADIDLCKKGYKMIYSISMVKKSIILYFISFNIRFLKELLFKNTNEYYFSII